MQQPTHWKTQPTSAEVATLAASALSSSPSSYNTQNDTVSEKISELTQTVVCLNEEHVTMSEEHIKMKINLEMLLYQMVAEKAEESQIKLTATIINAARKNATHMILYTNSIIGSKSNITDETLSYLLSKPPSTFHTNKTNTNAYVLKRWEALTSTSNKFTPTSLTTVAQCQSQHLPKTYLTQPQSQLSNSSTRGGSRKCIGEDNSVEVNPMKYQANGGIPTPSNIPNKMLD